MKKYYLSLITVAFMSWALFSGCTSSAQKAEKAQKEIVEANREIADAQQDLYKAEDDLDKANQMYLQDIENYKAETADQVSDNEQRIAELRLRSKYIKKEDRDAYEMKILLIEKKNNELKTDMEDYLGEGPTKWEMFKVEFARDMDALGRAFKDILVKNK